MAGRIPQFFIDDLLNRVDIVEIIDSRVSLKKAGREYTACCPFHNEKTPSFTVSPNKQFFHCFGCGAHGTAVGFLMEYNHMSFPEAIEELARHCGLEIPYEDGKPDFVPQKQNNDLYDMLNKVDQFYQQQLRNHSQASRAVDYLKNRGLDGKTAAEFGVGFAPPGWDTLLPQFGQNNKIEEALIATGMLIKKDNGGCYDRFRDRIMFPIRDRRGRTIAFGGRILPDTQEKGAKAPAKYLNSPETALFHKGQELYGLYEARQALRDIPRLIVVEGYMDVVSLAQAGIQYAVATLGTATTVDHLNRLFRLTQEVVFCFDGDRAGREAAWRALENALPVMGEGRQIRFMFLPDGEDPDTQVKRVGKSEFEASIDAAMPFSEFFFQRLRESTSMQSIDGRAKLVEQARPLLSKMPDGIFKQLMTEQLAQLARMDTTGMNQLVTNPSSMGQSHRPVSHKASQKTPPSPVRFALQRLLHQPQMAQEIGDTSHLQGGDVPGLNLLLEVLEFLKKNPTLKTGTLIEHFRDTEHGKHLQKLAAWEPEFNEPVSLLSELSDTLKKLAETCLRQRYENLLIRSNQGQLTNEEEAEFSALFEQLKQYKQSSTK
ncbi:MAG: DNA primase [Gammaproteobacteria bacterium]|nr:DNA primase [Gammaproteobacteria bacterium]